MIQLSVNTSHINNGFGYQNVGAVIFMLVVQYSGLYEENYFDTISTYAHPVDNKIVIELSVVYTALHYSSEHQNDRTTNVRTYK